jgi:hypothetical protein
MEVEGGGEKKECTEAKAIWGRRKSTRCLVTAHLLLSLRQQAGRIHCALCPGLEVRRCQQVSTAAIRELRVALLPHLCRPTPGKELPKMLKAGCGYHGTLASTN